MSSPELLAGYSVEAPQANPEPLYGEIYRNGREVAERISGRLVLKDSMSSRIPYYFTDVPPHLGVYMPPNYLAKEPDPSDYLASGAERDIKDGATLWVTDKPEIVFGGNRKLYTVTSTLALENMYDGVVLRSPLEFSRLPISTHRGTGLAVFSELMYQMGYDLGQKDRAVWLGAKIDGEQVAIEDSIAQRGEDIDNELIPLFFAARYPGRMGAVYLKSYPADFTMLHPQLKAVFTGLMEGKSTYDEDPECRQYVDNLLERLPEYMGIRDGWFSMVAEILKGRGQPTFHPKATLREIENNVVRSAKWTVRHSKASRAVVLEIDTALLFDKTPVYPFPLTTRPPQTIIPTPWIPASAVTAVYVYSDVSPSEVGVFQDLLKPFDALPADKWLADANGRVVMPSTVDVESVDPTNPLCVFRYSEADEDPIATWAGHISAGHIAPLWVSMGPENSGNPTWLNRPPDLQTPRSAGEAALRLHVLETARQTGFAGELVTTDLPEWERQVLSAVQAAPLLPSVNAIKELPTSFFSTNVYRS